MNAKGIAGSLSGLTAIPISENEALSNLTSWGVGGPADFLIRVSNGTELRDVFLVLSQSGVPWIVLGNGTNVLISDQGFKGAVIKLEGEFKNIMTKGADWKAGAGSSLKKLVDLSKSESLSGLEFAAGIPGTIGGALRSNAGAYGNDIGSLLSGVEIFEEGVFQNLGPGDIQFTYRKSSLLDSQVVTFVSLRLKEGEGSEIEDRIKAYFQDRSTKHPLDLKTAGSVFKNPSGKKAALLILEAGLDGESCGDAQISTKHSNFIVNRGAAKASDIKNLMEVIRKRVSDVFGIDLEPEVRLIGEF